MARPTRKARQQLIVDVLEDAFAELMTADPRAFRGKFRKMAADPFAFYRGSACLFYADMTRTQDDWSDERTGAVWIHGDLHVENFGTYMNSDGRLVFDVNDFDEAYLGPSPGTSSGSPRRSRSSAGRRPCPRTRSAS